MAAAMIWDLPTRLFHWLLAVGFGLAALISLVVGEDGPLFPYHAMIGLTLCAAVCFRVMWGLVGTRYARLGSLALSPALLGAYFKGVLTGRGPKYLGHNPATSWAMIAMFLATMGLGVTGVMMARGDESVKEVHEILAYAMLALIGGHIAGVVLHTLRHRENLTLSMIHGHKDAEPGAAITSARPLGALLLLALVGGVMFGLLRNYNVTTREVDLAWFGTTLQLGENEQERGGDPSPEEPERGEQAPLLRTAHPAEAMPRRAPAGHPRPGADQHAAAEQERRLPERRSLGHPRKELAVQRARHPQTPTEERRQQAAHHESAEEEQVRPGGLRDVVAIHAPNGDRRPG